MPSVINSGLPITDVLRECGSDVNELPGYTRCPRCNMMSLYVVELPKGGGWYQCQGSCGLTGESLELIAAKKNVDIKDLLRLRKMQDSYLFSPANCKESLETINFRSKVFAGWRDVSDRGNIFLLGGPTVTEMAAVMRIDRHVQAEYWNDSMGRLFGIATNDQIAKNFTRDRHRLLTGVKDKAWLLTPMYDVPGHICGFSAMDHTSKHEAFMVEGQDPGLLFLHAPKRGRVKEFFAIGSPKHALALHILAQNSHDEPPPLVSYYSNTVASAWQYVRGSRIILWDTEMNVSLFETARKIGARAHVARYPTVEPHPDPYVQFNGLTHNMVLEHMRQSAVPWLHAFKDYLIQLGSSAAIDDVVEKIMLTADELQQLNDICTTPGERETISGLYKMGNINANVVLGNGQVVIHKSEGWFRKVRDQHALISGAVPRVEQVVKVQGSAKSPMLRGTVQIGSHNPEDHIIFPFAVREEDFKPSWLRAFCAENGHFVNVLDSLNLYDVATRFHKPIIVKGIERVGWEAKTGRFVFPNCYVANGEMREDDFLLEEEHPSESLKTHAMLFKRETVENWLRLPGVYWSTYLMGLYNIVAPALGHQPIPVAVLNSGAAPIARMAAVNLYCPFFSDRDKDKALATAGKHNMPVFMTAKQKAYASEILTTPNPHNLIVELGCEESAHLAKLLGWYVVAGSADELDAAPGKHDLLPELLMEMQRSSLAPGKDPGATVLELLQSWLQRVFELRDQKLQNLVGSVSVPDMSPEGVGERLIGLIRLLVKAGELPVKSGGMITDLLPHKFDAVRSGTEVCVPVEGFVKATSRVGISYHVTAQATEALEATGKLLRVIDSLGRPVGWVLSHTILEH